MSEVLHPTVEILMLAGVPQAILVEPSHNISETSRRVFRYNRKGALEWAYLHDLERKAHSCQFIHHPTQTLPLTMRANVD